MNSTAIEPIRYRYSRKEHKDFYPELYKRVEKYFKEHGYSKFGDWRIVAKIAFLFMLFFGSYILMYLPQNSPMLVLFWAIIFGLTSSLIGLNIVHDASHNALFKKRAWNKLLLFSMNLIGSTGYTYRLNHVKIHHNFPNVIGIDADLNQPSPFIRFSPGAAKLKIHRFQHLYAPFIYLFYTLNLIFIKDFQDFKFIPKKDSPLLDIEHPPSAYLEFFISKLFYIGYALILPFLFLNIIWWKILIGYLLVNIVMSILLVSLQVLIHSNDKAHFIECEKDGLIRRNWAIHNLLNTTDIHADSKFLTFWLGGLNTHTVHHLFPGICHIHYVDLTKILKSTVKEFNLTYTNFTIWESIRSHFIFLKQMGKEALSPFQTKTVNEKGHSI